MQNCIFKCLVFKLVVQTRKSVRVVFIKVCVFYPEKILLSHVIPHAWYHGAAAHIEVQQSFNMEVATEPSIMNLTQSQSNCDVRIFCKNLVKLHPTQMPFVLAYLDCCRCEYIPVGYWYDDICKCGYAFYCINLHVHFIAVKLCVCVWKIETNERRREGKIPHTTRLYEKKSPFS